MKNQFSRLYFAFDTKVTLATFFVHVSFPKLDRISLLTNKEEFIVNLDQTEAQAEKNFRRIKKQIAERESKEKQLASERSNNLIEEVKFPRGAADQSKDKE